MHNDHINLNDIKDHTNRSKLLKESEFTLINSLKKALLRYRLVKLSEGILGSICYTLIAISVFLILDWFILFPEQKRYTILIIESALFIASFVLLGLYPAIRGLTKSETALLIENKFPSENRLISSVQYIEKKFDDSTSILMQEINLIESSKILSVSDSRDSVPLKRIFSFAKITGSLLISFLLIIAIIPDNFQVVAERMFLAETKNISSGKISISVSPGNITLKKSSPLRITAKILGYLPVNGFVKIISGEDTRTSQMNPVSRKNGVFETYINSVDNTFYYQIVFDSLPPKGPFVVDVQHPPLITALETEIKSPDYTRIPLQKIQGEFDAVSVIENSKIKINAYSNKLLKNASLFVTGTSNEIETILMTQITSESTGFYGEFTVETSAKMKIGIIDSEGLTTETIQSMRIHCIEDKKPLIEILRPGRDIELAEDSIVPLSYRSRDDFGIRSITLYFTYQDQPLIPVPLYIDKSEDKTDILSEFPWDLSFYPLGPEDILIYYIEAEDNCALKGFQKTKTSTFSVRVPSLYEYFQKVNEEEEEHAKELEKILASEQEIMKQAKQIERKIKRNEDLNWEDRKKIENLEQEQKKIIEQSKKLQEKLEETVKKMQKNSLFDWETIEKVKEMQKLLDEVVDKEMMEVIKELQQAKEQIAVSKEEMKKMMENISEKEFKTKLDRMIDLLKKIKQEQTLKAAITTMKSAIDTQKRISEELKKLKEKEKLSAQDMQKMKKLALEEKSLNKTMESIKKDLEKLTADMGEKEKELKDNINKALEKMEKSKLQGLMQDAEQQMSDQNPSEAKINIDETIPKLEEMQNALSMALEGMQNESKNKLSGLVKKATGLAIRISKKQEEMNELISGRKQLFENRTIYPENDPILELLGGQQLEINEAVDKLTEIVVELSSSTFLISPYTVSLCSIIKKRLVECSKALSEKNTPIAGKISNDSLLLINLLIAQLLETMDNMNQNSGSGMGFEEMMENLKKMTQQQGQMSQMTQQMMQQLSQNGSLSEFQQEMLKQMQAQQNMMRQAMEEMANSSIDDQLGKKLKEIAKEMKESDSLYKPESLKRLEKQQRKIQERMLDAQKSLHKEKESPKRLARTANEKDFKRSAPAREIEKFNTLREKSRIESENIEKSIPAYQKIIKEYFHRLSKSGE